MIWIVLLVILGIFLYFLFRKDTGTSSNNESRYSKTGNWTDFDPGVDSDKVGDPKYPNAGIDSVMKHEFLDDVMKDEK